MDSLGIEELASRLERLERRHRHWRWATAALIGLSLAIAPLAVMASHRFSDVPTGNAYHADIAAVAAHGILNGCSATKFCPKSTVTREQAAAFLHRGLGRVTDFGAFGASFTGSFRQLPGGAELTVPGPGMVLVFGTLTVYNSSTSGCPCMIEMQLAMGGNRAQVPHSGTVANATTNGDASMNVSASQIFQASAKGTVRPTMLLRQASGTAVIFGNAEIQALWVPFDGQGR
jgi:hypothetical protein